MISVRLAGYVAVLLVFLPTGLAAAFFAVQMAVFGVALGASFVLQGAAGERVVPADGFFVADNPAVVLAGSWVDEPEAAVGEDFVE